MALPIFEHPHSPNFFVPVRQKLLAHYGIRPKNDHRPKIVYIDRQQSDRHLPEKDHESLLELLSALSQFVDARRVILEDVPLREQIEMVADCTVSRLLSVSRQLDGWSGLKKLL